MMQQTINLTPSELKVLIFIKENPHCTDREIANELYIHVDNVTLWRNKLININKIEVSGNKLNKRTGHENMTYRVITKESEKELENQLKKSSRMIYREMRQLASRGLFKCSCCKRSLPLDERSYSNKSWCRHCRGG